MFLNRYEAIVSPSSMLIVRNPWRLSLDEIKMPIAAELDTFEVKFKASMQSSVPPPGSPLNYIYAALYGSCNDLQKNPVPAIPGSTAELRNVSDEQ